MQIVFDFNTAQEALDSFNAMPTVKWAKQWCEGLEIFVEFDYDKDIISQLEKHFNDTGFIILSSKEQDDIEDKERKDADYESTMRDLYYENIL